MRIQQPTWWELQSSSVGLWVTAYPQKNPRTSTTEHCCASNFTWEAIVDNRTVKPHQCWPWSYNQTDRVASPCRLCLALYFAIEIYSLVWEPPPHVQHVRFGEMNKWWVFGSAARIPKIALNYSTQQGRVLRLWSWWFFFFPSSWRTYQHHLLWCRSELEQRPPCAPDTVAAHSSVPPCLTLEISSLTLVNES